MFRSVYSVLLCFSVYFLCVNVYCNTASVCQPNCSWQIYQYHKNTLIILQKYVKHYVVVIPTNTIFNLLDFKFLQQYSWRFKFSFFLRRADWCEVTDFSLNNIIFSFRFLRNVRQLFTHHRHVRIETMWRIIFQILHSRKSSGFRVNLDYNGLFNKDTAPWMCKTTEYFGIYCSYEGGGRWVWGSVLCDVDLFWIKFYRAERINLLSGRSLKLFSK